MENWFIPDQVSQLPQAERVLVLAPHPDDEVFGCAGAALKYTRAGAWVRARVLTEGGGYLQGDARSALASTRRLESARAAQTLGMAPPVFADFTDRELSAINDLHLRVRSWIEIDAPNVIFAPSLWEIHPDHRACAWAVLKALYDMGKEGLKIPQLLQFEVGAALRPNFLLDITQEMPTKQAAMLEFGSQITSRRYEEQIKSLNTFRTCTLPNEVIYAEAYVLVSDQQLDAWLNPESGKDPTALYFHLEEALLAADTASQNASTQFVQTWTQLKSVEQSLAILVQDHQLLVQDHQLLVQDHQLRVAQADGLQAELAQVYASRSWRVTAPLRWLLSRCKM